MTAPAPRAVYTLTGSGTQALSAGVTRLQLSVVADSGTMRIGRANPRNTAQQGAIRFGDATGWYRPEWIDGDLVWFDAPPGSTRFGYSMLDGASFTATEDFAKLGVAEPWERNPIPHGLGTMQFSPALGSNQNYWSYTVPANRIFMLQSVRAGVISIATWTTGVAVAWLGASWDYHPAEARCQGGYPLGEYIQYQHGMNIPLPAGASIGGWYNIATGVGSANVLVDCRAFGVEFDA